MRWISKGHYIKGIADDYVGVGMDNEKKKMEFMEL